jgi:hypothetical protein
MSDCETFERPKGLKAKLAAIMGEIGFVQKRGRNEIQRYDYVQASDVAGTVAKLCSKYGIAFWPSEEVLEYETRETSKGAAMFHCRARMKFTFADVDSDETIVVPSTGEGQDMGEKGIFKARTGALKYCLLQTFLIAAGDDPENETEEHDLKPPEGPVTKVSEPPKRLICPECGQGTIIKGRPEFGGGYVCYKKLGGCNAKFRDDEEYRFHPTSGRPDNMDRDNRAVGDTPAGANVEGNGPSVERDTISQEQIGLLEGLCQEFGVSPATMIQQYRMRDGTIKTLADLTPRMFEHATKVFDAKRKKLQDLN